jgi:demethylmenaquinone methyltransferase/2-methoxy-6-polyprenyl-1,4-benzoquinol methylase
MGGSVGENTTGQDAATHDRQIQEMFSGIASVYDRMNGILSLGLDARWRRNLASAIKPTAVDLLDACSGTGELILTAKSMDCGQRYFASDFCEPMLRAGLRDNDLGRGVSVSVADTQRLPYADASFDAVMVGFGLRNLGDLSAGLLEIRRVLRPGGQLLVLEFFRQDRTAALQGYLAKIVPLLGRVVGNDQAAYRYLPESMQRFLSVGEFCSLAGRSGFGPGPSIQRQTMGVAHLVVLEVV